MRSSNRWLLRSMLILAALCFAFRAAVLDIVSADFTNSHAVGINYGQIANNLPSPAIAVQLMKSINVGYVKIYDADPQILTALANTSLPLVITVANQEIPNISSSSANANQWVQKNVLPYYPATRILMIMVGNEVLSDTQIQSTWSQLVPAMENLQSSLVKNNLDGSIKVTTSVAMDALASSYPPSNGSFKSEIAESVIQPMLSFLNRTDSYFFLDVYPYFAWSSNPANISLNYALFALGTAAIQDGQLHYSNMLDAQLDAVVAAMAELGFPHVKLAISETGWPTKGGTDQPGANVANAVKYNHGLVARFSASPPVGTPRRPGAFIPAFIFSLFNENQKPGAITERNWGVFYPSGTPIYSIDLSGSNQGSTYPPIIRSGTNNNTESSAPSGAPVPHVAAPAAAPSSTVQQQWCVAKTGENNMSALQDALNYACGAGADCSAIQAGNACYQPNTVAAHASYAFNSYWQSTKFSGGTCDFNGVASLTASDPSFEGCSFPLQ